MASMVTNVYVKFNYDKATWTSKNLRTKINHRLFTWCTFLRTRSFHGLL